MTDNRFESTPQEIAILPLDEALKRRDEHQREVQKSQSKEGQMNEDEALAKVNAAKAMAESANDTEPDGDPDDPCVAEHLKKMLADGMPKADALAKATDMCKGGETPTKEPKPRKSFDERLRAGLKTLGLLKDEPDTATAFKVAGNHWVASWSNNLEDRDGEIFTAKAIDDFVARVDMGAVPKPELWVWHVPGSRIGQAEWVDRHGHFLMAMGTFDDTDAGRKARDFYSKHAGSKSLSHGFTFPVSQFDGKHYHQFNTFEISLLPRGAEANLYTSLEGVKEMAKVISETKKAELFAAFGEDVGARILAAEDAKGKALDDLGINSKDFVQPTADNGAANKEAVDAANKAFADLVPDLMEGSAEAVIAANEAVKVVKAWKADYETRIKAMQATIDALRADFEQRPRASASKSTIIPESDPLAVKSQAGLTAEQEALKDGPLSGMFSNG